MVPAAPPPARLPDPGPAVPGAHAAAGSQTARGRRIAGGYARQGRGGVAPVARTGASTWAAAWDVGMKGPSTQRETLHFLASSQQHNILELFPNHKCDLRYPVGRPYSKKTSVNTKSRVVYRMATEPGSGQLDLKPPLAACVPPRNGRKALRTLLRQVLNGSQETPFPKLAPFKHLQAGQACLPVTSSFPFP